MTQHQILDFALRPLNIGILPTPSRIEGLRFWRFVISGLIFDLKLDDQPLQKSADLWPVNCRERAIVWVERPILATEIPGFGRELPSHGGPFRRKRASLTPVGESGVVAPRIWFGSASRSRGLICGEWSVYWPQIMRRIDHSGPGRTIERPTLRAAS